MNEGEPGDIFKELDKYGPWRAYKKKATHVGQSVGKRACRTAINSDDRMTGVRIKTSVFVTVPKLYAGARYSVNVNSTAKAIAVVSKVKKRLT